MLKSVSFGVIEYVTVDGKDRGREVGWEVTEVGCVSVHVVLSGTRRKVGCCKQKLTHVKFLKLYKRLLKRTY